MMKANNQLGFININEDSIDKIIKDDEVIFERGFLREKTSTTLPTTFGGVGKNLKDYRVYGNTVQNGEPTPDVPIEMVSCGDRTKNLIPTNPDDWEQGGIEARTGSQIESTVRLRNKDYCEIENDKDYYVSLESLNYSYVNIILYDNNKSYLGQYYNIDNRINGTNKIKINIPSLSIANVKYMRVVVKKTNSTTIIPEEISTIKPMITLGDTKLDFEPYGYKIPVNVRSDNLFDKDNANLVHLYTDGTVIKNSAGANTYYIKCKSNTTYTIIKSNTGTNNRFCVFTCDDIPTAGIQILNYIGTPAGADNSVKYTINTPNTAKYLCVFVGVASTTPSVNEISNSIQILEGSTAPSKYIPYYNETTNIYLDGPLRGIDGYSDYIDFINGKIVRQIGETIFDGSETWNKVGDTSGNYFYFYSTVLDNIVMKDITKNMLCNKFNVYNGQIVYTTKVNTDTINVSNRTSSQRLRVLLLNTRINSYTTANFKTWLSENNVTVDYVLETPTEESITLPNIPTVDENNTLNIETEITPSKVYIKYKSNS